MQAAVFSLCYQPDFSQLAQGFIQPQKSGTHYFLVLIALCFGPYRTISENGTHNEYQKSPEWKEDSQMS